MKMFTLKRYAALLGAAIVLSLSLQSCGEGRSNLTNQEVADLQEQLDSTMQMYMQLKSENSQFDSQMAERDSIITAQAAEIQRLIDSMKGGKKNAATSTVNNDQIEKQQKVIRDKENTIKQLQKKLDEQTKQLNSLKTSNGEQKNDNAELARLQKQIAQQEKQIKDLKAETKKLKDNTASNSNCEKEKKSFEEQVKDLKGEIAGYKNQIADLNKQIKSLRKEYNQIENENKKDNESTELSVTKEEMRQLTVQLNECRKLNTQYQNDVKAANDNLKAMSQKEAECRTQNEELKQAQQNIAQKCENDKQALQAHISDLQQQVFVLQSKVDQLTSENANLAKSQQSNATDNTAATNKTIADLNAQVEAQRSQIEQLQADLRQKDKELAAAKSNTNTNAKSSKGAVNQKLADLQSLCDSYAAEIERLRAENTQLKGENAQLKEQVASNANLFAENERLQQKVKLASVLVTSDLKATPGKSVKVGNVVKPTTKASQTNYVRIDCRIMDNNVIDPGSMTIFARISNAADRAICNGNPENYTFDFNGVQMQYTTKQDIEFTGSGRMLTMLWKKSESLQLGPGLYWVKLYANGYEIGKASFKLE